MGMFEIGMFALCLAVGAVGFGVIACGADVYETKKLAGAGIMASGLAVVVAACLIGKLFCCGG